MRSNCLSREIPLKFRVLLIMGYSTTPVNKNTLLIPTFVITYNSVFIRVLRAAEMYHPSQINLMKI